MAAGVNKRGPKHKPTAELSERGSKMAALRAFEPKIEALHDAPPCPAHLTGYAAECWNEHALRLSSAGILTAADLLAFTGLCIQWGKYREAEDKLKDIYDSIQTAESGYTSVSGMEVIANKRWAQFLQSAVQFGMTPSSRANVHAAPQKKGEVVLSVFDKAKKKHG